MPAIVGRCVVGDEGGHLERLLFRALGTPPGGLSGPIVLALCYFVFRSLHLLLFFTPSGADCGLRRQLTVFAPSMLIATCC